MVNLNLKKIRLAKGVTQLHLRNDVYMGRGTNRVKKHQDFDF